MTEPRSITLTFPTQKFKYCEVISVELILPVMMRVERVILPRAGIGRFRVRQLTSGLEQITSGVDYEALATLEGPSPFAPFDAWLGQGVVLTLENVTEEDQILEGAILRGEMVHGTILRDKDLVELLDRGTALAAQSDTENYGKGWLAAAAMIDARRVPFGIRRP